ncbi:uncharacterized protein LOC143375950 [Andrena cerasifolii]|uniref:uncharacterized protein LOC143375950 n=1 Tax=Andrena cerasifolii TaxID=2819439 RepID=UPI0040378794
MKQARYRVEAFIIPVHKKCSTSSVLMESDDVKMKLQNVHDTVNIENESSCIQSDRDNSLVSEDESMQNFRNYITLEKLESRLSNGVNKSNSVNFYSSLIIPETRYQVLYDVDSASFSANVFNEAHRLSTIDEKSEESEDKLADLCYHGCENGCSATVPTPQEVSEEVFKKNWLQKLKDIKRREEVLRSKEMNFQYRERALSQKEREVKALERLLKDKLKQADLHLKESKHVEDLLKVHNSQENTLEPSINCDLKEAHKHFNTNVSAKEVNDTDAKKLSSSVQNVKMQETFSNQAGQVDKRVDNVDTAEKDSQEKTTSTGSSSCSSDNSLFEGKRSKRLSTIRSSMTLKSSGYKSAYSGSNRMRKPSKIYYEDLDTTLSADIGDSSFVQTSQKFNPELYKKPSAFTRSASERRGKSASSGVDVIPEVQNVANPKQAFQVPRKIEQDKVLKRVTQNISVSQDKGTKFQNYGLIDNGDIRNKVDGIENEGKYSYLNLETSNSLRSHEKLIKGSKDRPLSWNEETNEWLLKKRKAYNMTMRKASPEDAENKENLKCGMKTNKSEKVISKRDIKSRILTIFR